MKHTCTYSILFVVLSSLGQSLYSTSSTQWFHPTALCNTCIDIVNSLPHTIVNEIHRLVVYRSVLSPEMIIHARDIHTLIKQKNIAPTVVKRVPCIAFSKPHNEEDN